MLTPGVSVKQVLELAPKDRRRLDRRLVQRRCDRRSRRFDDGCAAHGHGFRDIADSEPRQQIDRLTYGEIDVVLNEGAEPRQPERRRVAARGKLEEHEAAVRICRAGLREIRLWIDDRHLYAWQHGTRRVHHCPLNDARRDLGLCGESGGEAQNSQSARRTNTRGIGASVAKRSAAKTAEQ